jgi:Zn-dependent peptidase ImmA (M78 family)
VVLLPKNPTAEAERLLRGVWAEICEGEFIPVDPIEISHNLGIDVFVAQLESDVSGAIVIEPGRDPRILLNRDDHPNRVRFTCAHELGHYVNNSDDPVANYRRTDLRGPLASTGQDQDEIFANQFAACLLMPEWEVRERFQNGASVAELAFQFRVSGDAMSWRLKNLHLLG